jgi:preprotein translocase SecF subunit
MITLKLPTIDFVKVRRIAIAGSIIFILAGIVVLAVRGGFRMGIDFTGGVVLQLKTSDKIGIEDLRKSLEKSGIESSIQNLGMENNHEFLIRTRIQAKNNMEIIKAVEESLVATFGTNNLKLPFEKTDMVGPSMSKYITQQAFWLIMVSLGLMLIYITIRFRFVYGVGAIVSLFHDVLTSLTAVILFNKEITVLIISAVLTLIGYSIMDTIVVFDRIREGRNKYRDMEYPLVVNKSINETLARTIITSVTVFLAALSLFLFGGAVIHDFAFVMCFGVVTGTYSSIFIASPVLVEWYYIRKKQGKQAAL